MSRTNKNWTYRRNRRKSLDGSTIGPNLETLPSICLRHILSFLSYEKASRLRSVSKTFNEICLTHLNSGCQQLNEALEREIRVAEERVLVPSSQRAAFDTALFFSCLRIQLMLLSWVRCKFVAGKALDEARRLFTGFKGPSTPIPFVIEDPYLPTAHPLLHPLYKLKIKAFSVIIRCVPIPTNQNNINVLCKLGEQRREMLLKVEENKRKIYHGEQMNREVVKAMLRLNEKVLKLIKSAKEVDQWIGRRSFLVMDLTVFDHTSNKIAASERVIERSKLNLLGLPSNSVKNILSHLTYEKVSKLRAVCKTFNEVCKTFLTEEVEVIVNSLEWKCQDRQGLLQFCRDTFRSGMGREYYFSAGKVLDVVNIYENINYPANYNFKFKSKALPIGFTLIEHVQKATTHFRQKIMLKYFPGAGLLQIKPCEDFIASADKISPDKIRCSFKLDYELNIRELEKTLTGQEVVIEKLKQKNRLVLNTFLGLKKSFEIMNEEVSVTLRIILNRSD